jgi:hypothetical protein
MPIPKPNVPKVPNTGRLSKLLANRPHSPDATAVKTLDNAQVGEYGVRQIDVKGTIQDGLEGAELLASSQEKREPRPEAAVTQTAARLSAEQLGFNPAPLLLGASMLLIVAMTALGISRDPTIRRLLALGTPKAAGRS